MTYLCAHGGCARPGTVRIEVPNTDDLEEARILLFCQRHSENPDWDRSKTKRDDE